MPGGDGTGPFGQGPRTGRGAGWCAGGAGAGFGGGRGRRMRGHRGVRGWGYGGPMADPAPVNGRQSLATPFDALLEKLDDLSERLARLESREPKPE